MRCAPRPERVAPASVLVARALAALLASALALAPGPAAAGTGVRLTYPNGGETLLTGTANNVISWELLGTTPAKVGLSYTLDGGRTWKGIKTVAGGENGYGWTVPRVARARRMCKIRVVLRNAAGRVIGRDVSDRFFTIGGGTLPLQLVLHDAGFFSIRRPRGWQVHTAGVCSTFAFVIQDPNQPLRRIFYFGLVGPVYLNEQQRVIDQWYVDHGGFPIPWIDAPAVDPLTPEEFFERWPAIAAMNAARQFMPVHFPSLEAFERVSTSPQVPMMGVGSTSLLRGLFTEGGQVAQGQFLGSVWQFSPFTGNPGQGTAYGGFIVGATAPEAEFASHLGKLVAALESFTVSPQYVNWCFGQSQNQWGAVRAAGQTLSEAAEVAYEGWQARTQAQDILAEQYTDGLRGTERVYDPGTGQVFQVPNGWYADYDPRRQQFDMSGLQQLPDANWILWSTAPVDGSLIH